MFPSKAQPLAAALLGAALLATPTVAQGAFAKALPQDTIFYVSFPDTRTSFEEFKGTALWKMWREPEVQDFFADAIELAKEQWEQNLAQAREAFAQGMMPFDPDQLLKLRPPHAMSFALTRMSLVPQEGRRDPLPRFGLVAHVDFGDTAPLWRELIDTGIGMAVAQAGDELARSERDVAGTKVLSFGPTDAPEGMDMRFELAWSGSALVIGSLREDVDRLLTGLQSGAGGLAETASFKQVASHLRVDGAEAEFYLRPGALLDFLTDTLEIAASTGELPPQVDVGGIERVIRALGLRAVDGIGMTASYVDGRGVNETFVAAPKSARTGFLADTTGAVDRSLLRWIPKDAASFSIGRMDLGNVYRTLVAALRSYDEQLAEGLLGQLAQIEQQVGVSVEKDLFGALADEYVSWSMPMAGFAAAPEAALVWKVHDQDSVVRTLGAIAAQTNGMLSLDKLERRGITVYQLRLNSQALPTSNFGGMNPFAMFQPTFGFQDGYLVAAWSTGDVKRAFTRMEREDDPSGDVRSSPEFAPLLAQVPEDADSLSFTDWKAQFESFYQLVTGILAFVPLGEDVPFDLTLLPDSQTLTQHLSGAVSWSRRTDAGLVSTSTGPFGIETLALIGGALVGAGVVGATIREGAPMVRIR